MLVEGQRLVFARQPTRRTTPENGWAVRRFVHDDIHRWHTAPALGSCRAAWFETWLQCCFGLLIKDRHCRFHAPLCVACHKIGRGNIDFLSREGTKQIDSGMFQKSPHDADHANIVGFSGNAGLQATDPPYDHIDLHAGF